MSANHFRALSGATLKTVGALSIALAFAQPVNAVPFTWDPSLVGLAGASSFSGDALKATEVSHIHFTSPSTWEEHGFAKITGIVDHGVESTPSNLNSNYTLYFKFDGTGDFASSAFTSATVTLYGVNGASTFGIDGNHDAFVDSGVNTAVPLAINTLVKGTSGGGAGSDLFADLWTTFAPTAAGAAMFLAPYLPGGFYGHYLHPLAEQGGVQFIADGGGNLTDIVLNGGNDTLSFIPEPASLMLLAGGLPGLLRFRRRKTVA